MVYFTQPYSIGLHGLTMRCCFASLIIFYCLLQPALAQVEDAYLRGKSGILPSGQGPSAEDLKKSSESANNWLYHTHNYAGTRYSPLIQITRHNISALRPICIAQLGGESDFQSGPIVYDGVIYLTSGRDTIAVNAEDCRIKWRNTWQEKNQGVTLLSTTNRGVAIQDGYVVRGTSDGYLLALDAFNGELLWARRVAAPEDGEHFTMAPMIYDGTILIGPAGGDNGVSGWLGAFSLLGGEPLWRFDTVPGGKNSLGVKVGGGAIWTPLSLDIENESVYVAVTNPAPDFAAALNAGNNLYTNSVVSLDVKTGRLNWYKQLLPDDDHGWDLTQVSPLFSTENNNHIQKLLATTGKDGKLRVLDRESHEQIYMSSVTLQLNTDEPVTLGGTYTCPGVLGGVLWNGPALEPNEGLLITPAANLCSTFYRSQEVRYIEGRDYYDGSAVSDPSTLSGWLTAVDMRTGEIRWKYETALPMLAAVTTTAGGLVLSGQMDGDFIVLDSADGSLLYRFNTGGAIGGGVVSYGVDGRQYFAVASGSPSEHQVNGDMGAPTLVVFGLPSDEAF